MAISAADIKREKARQRARALCFMRPQHAEFGYDTIRNNLYDIRNACDDVQYAMDEAGGVIEDAFDGDGEMAWEFRMAFADLQNAVDQLDNDFDELLEEFDGRDNYEKEFNDLTVAILGEQGEEMLGYDTYAEDYFDVEGYSQTYAINEARKRLERLTKRELINRFSIAWKIVSRYLDIKMEFDYLQATYDIFTEQNVSLLRQIDRINEEYGKVMNWGSSEVFDNLVDALPEMVWIAG